MSLKCYVDVNASIELDGRRYCSPELLPWVGGYVYASVDESIGAAEVMCFDMQDRFICCATNPQLARARQAAQREADQRFSMIVWNCVFAYGAAAWLCVGLTAIGVTEWSWFWALAPMWAPTFVVFCGIVLLDLYRSSRSFARACRRAWARVTRPLRRLA